MTFRRSSYVMIAGLLLCGLAVLWAGGRHGGAIAPLAVARADENQPSKTEKDIPMTDQPKQNWRQLTPEEERVIVHKGTERPFTGEYTDKFDSGVYVCRRCGAMLYRSQDKFHADCGWPAFDQALPGAVKSVPDPDGQRTEIECANCGAHLGHVFTGEHLTDKNTRFCVNSISMLFVPENEV